MDKLYEKPESSRRWIWELLQNAVDIAYNNQVKIEVEMAKNYVEFRHSGKPFTNENIVFLIEQTSSKQRTESIDKSSVETTGCFGTGFITTHLLSKVIEISGVFHDPEENTYQKFRLTLNREGST